MHRFFRQVDAFALTLPLLLLLAHCGSDDPSGGGGSGGDMTSSSGGMGGAGGGALLPDLDTKLTWYGDNRARLDAMIDAKGANDPGYDPQRKPVAVFDWDNTVIKNDIGDATMFWMLNHDKVLQPPGKSWRSTSPFLTSEAATSLSDACDALAPAGQPLPTSTETACADEILSVYYDATTTGGAAAYAAWNYRIMEPAYAWAAQLQAGYTPAEVSAFADLAIAEALAAPADATQTVGSTTGMNAYLRIYDQIADLIDVMQKNGFDVWVVSASSQPIVEPFAARVGIAADHVIGIRLLTDDSGKLTYNLRGCGPVADGSNDGMGGIAGNSLITYIDGKRCWINKGIYGDTTAGAIEQNPDTKERQVFGAGDSDTDISFLKDATALKLAINRNKKELMCNAYNDYQDSWLVNPMFIAPKPELAGGYPCSTTACRDESGASVPCVDEGGMAIADQQDTVF
jgi:phosphoglycolate phosphatase-like HAD superfamily hydrolase